MMMGFMKRKDQTVRLLAGRVMNRDFDAAVELLRLFVAGDHPVDTEDVIRSVVLITVDPYLEDAA
jgi:hypothetical protein